MKSMLFVRALGISQRFLDVASRVAAGCTAAPLKQFWAMAISAFDGEQSVRESIGAGRHTNF
jgi:hypothetical protein